MTQLSVPEPSNEAWEILEGVLRAWGMDVPQYMNGTVTAIQAAAGIDRALAKAREDSPTERMDR